MNKKLLLSGILLSFIFIGCSSDDPSSSKELIDDTFKVNADATQLQGAISLEGAGVLTINSLSESRRALSKTAEDAPQVSNIALEQIALVKPPVVNGITMRASHVEVSGNYAYVSYMLEGDGYLGGIDIINIKDKYNPYVVNRMTSEIADVTSVFFLDDKLYFAAAIDNDLMTDLLFRANLGMVSVSEGNFGTDFQVKSIPGFVAVDILGVDNSIVGVSGDTGVIGLYNPEGLSGKKALEVPDLRSAAYGNGKLAALSGENGLLILNPNSLAVENTIAVQSLLDESKRTIAFNGASIMVSEGANGVGIYDVNSGSLIKRLSIQLDPDAIADSGDKVTNAVSLAGDFILMANGGAGFGVVKLDTNNTLIEQGIVGIEGSTNYVKAQEDYIFVASGAGGLRIIKMSKASAGSGVLACDTYGPYTGNSNLNINSNQEESFGGSTTLKHLNVGGKFTYCGSLNIEKSTNINSNGEFNMKGSLAIGTYGKNDDLNINSNAVLKIEGDLTVYGNLNLNSGATLEFVGDHSTIHVYGKVNQNSGSTLIGDYTDTSDKLE